MSDADFVKIKAAFPRLRWRRVQKNGADWWTRNGATAVRDGWQIEVGHAGDNYWNWSATFGLSGGVDEQTLGLARCLRSLRCAMRRQAKALAEMAGEA